MRGRSRWLLAALLVCAAALYAIGVHRYGGVDALLARRDELLAWRAAHPWTAAIAYVGVYVAFTSLSLPGALGLTLLGGGLFGLTLGTLLVSFASSAGATLAFLSARFVLRDWVQARFAQRLQAIDEGVRREGGFYLFALRLVPLMPFFLVNLAMGLTPMPTRTFYWVSQLGMLPATLIYVEAGVELGQLQISGALIAALALLGLFPLLARRALQALRKRRLYASWPRPARFEFNLVVVGAGAAGLVSAYIACATRARVALVECGTMGGDCLNTGCVPSKTLIRSARLLAQIGRSDEFGIRAHGELDFAATMRRVARVVRAIEPNDSVQRYTALGAECIAGRARITSPWTVEVDTGEGRRTLSTRGIVIATGAAPFVPPIPGLEQTPYLTSETIWNLRELPPRLLVLGGGPIGCEMAQAFARLGSKVTQVEMLPRILPREDPDVSELIAAQLRGDGVRLLTGYRAERFLVERERRVLVAASGSDRQDIEFDQVLVALGRRPRTSDLGLESLGIETDAGGAVKVDAWMCTRFANITACGDAAGPHQFTHLGAHQAWYATVNALFGRFHRVRYDDRVLPWATFVDPEVARVGLNEQQARETGTACETTVFRMDRLDRAIADGRTEGFVKVLTPPGSDRILGVTIVASQAAELLTEYVLAMKHRVGLKGILGTIHTYPTMSEANKYAAGSWRRAQVTLGQSDFLAALQAWMRGSASLATVLGRVPALLRDRRKAGAATA